MLNCAFVIKLHAEHTVLIIEFDATVPGNHTKCTEINTVQFFSGKLSFQTQKDGYRRYLQMEDVYFNCRHTAMLTGVINLLSEHFWLSVFQGIMIRHMLTCFSDKGRYIVMHSSFREKARETAYQLLNLSICWHYNLIPAAGLLCFFRHVPWIWVPAIHMAHLESQTPGFSPAQHLHPFGEWTTIWKSSPSLPLCNSTFQTNLNIRKPCVTLNYNNLFSGLLTIRLPNISSASMHFLHIPVSHP